MATLKISRSKIWKKAWAFIKAGVYSNLSDSLIQSWKYFKLRAQLLTGKASFSFRKVSGEIREAIGTLFTSLIDYTPKGTSKPSPVNICKYWDIDKQAYRCFKIENLI